jgi:translation initiation factor 5B
MAKKDKKKAKQQDDYWDTGFQEDAAALDSSVKNEENEGPAKADAEDPAVSNLADEFGGLMAAIKKSKGKKGKKAQVEMVDANEELEALEQDVTIPSANGDAKTAVADEEDEEDAGEFRVKTKKEKEKEKKEKEKAKKKAQVSLFSGFYSNVQGREEEGRRRNRSNPGCSSRSC